MGTQRKLCINDNPDYSTTCPLGGGNYGHWSQHQEWVCSGGDVACGGGEPACFLAGTKVDTPSGQKNIEDLKEGDKVLSFDKTTKKVVENYVLTPVVTTKTGYYLIKTVSGREIKVTAEHPIYVGTKSSLLRRIFGYSNPVITSYSLITP
ncbi:TPA: hypothetical protein DCY43_00020 [candidate division WWE3 bacterium]|uniref:Hint domain-containing protein n=1 Tax=candidate division WWE3 bacterium TaxID=2053526 RepID=A0A351JS64_UNCKA|nr:hypothetical protein [candidate division WWE3 bacterium]